MRTFPTFPGTFPTFPLRSRIFTSRILPPNRPLPQKQPHSSDLFVLCDQTEMEDKQASGQHDGDVLTGGGGRDGGEGGGGSLMTWINRKSIKSVSTKGRCGRARSG